MAGQRCDLTPDDHDPQSHWSSLSMLAQPSPVPANERMSSGVWRFNAGHNERECGQAGMIRQRLVQVITQKPPKTEPVSGQAQELAFGANALKEHDQLQFEEGEGVSQLSAMAFSASVEPLGADSLPVPVAGVTSRLKCANNMPVTCQTWESPRRRRSSEAVSRGRLDSRTLLSDPDVAIRKSSAVTMNPRCLSCGSQSAWPAR